MTTSIARSSHSISLLDGEIVEESELGSMRRVTADNFPILKGMSIKRVVLNPGSMRTPHWHANCNELTYCISGTALVSVLDDGSKFATFIVTAGQMFHANSGSLHHIENIGTDVAEFIIAFRSERPEDFGFGATLGAFTDSVLGNTYGLPASDFAAIRRSTTDHKLAGRGDRNDGVADAHSHSPPDTAWATRSPSFSELRTHPVASTRCTEPQQYCSPSEWRSRVAPATTTDPSRARTSTA